MEPSTNEVNETAE